ncbi:phospholipase D-like domain-containing protein [Pseudorhodoferax soli]|uniref:Phosphatidylserine/phosphatidylglycerophosphate/ cardiolipin synthase-like enzyme n=1 Tax=Pseudorhodoferax soli TaxID=545864 RepID=A0A368XN94_9BURK|nr:phospholipase D-like domain-containing protein [Pseudorhodoferax soli]RCW69443.1 phosphatidylserine/phosphatidylglycerophosphate/cardiolipin synthase-like enzyme [Pseudorhodoferax soli]
MSVVRVAIPLLKGKRKFFLEKGRPWSLAEHVLLAALTSNPRTVGELAVAGDIPQRLVLEALIRLMRAGWVTLQQESKGVVFSATVAGHSVVGDEELPKLAKSTSRWMNFVIDKVTGTLYRSREMPFVEQHVVERRAARERLVWLKPRDLDAFDDTAGVLATLFEDDEKFLGIEPSAEKMVKRFAIATVRGTNVEGVPPRAPAELVELVMRAARNAAPSPMAEKSLQQDPGRQVPFADRPAPRAIDAVFRPEDLILGGTMHEEVLHEAIKKAKHRIIIHSTFISEQGIAQVQPSLIAAAKRGAIIDVLWGEDENKTDAVTTAKTIAKVRSSIEAEGLSLSIRVHPFSTRSHAKILICDDGKSERLSATVGSCNWLSSGFQNYEASIRFSDPDVVSAVLEQTADLTRGGDRHWTELTSEMARLASDARLQKPPAGVKAKVTLVLGPQHAQFARLARDSARRRMFVTSHRIGSAARPSVVLPTIAAVREHGIEARVFYGVASEGTAGASTSHDGHPVPSVQPVLTPKLHAKILAWDDDHVLITSQNWLSADPGESNVRREIGLMVSSKGIAKAVIDNFDAARGDGGVAAKADRA